MWHVEMTANQAANLFEDWLHRWPRALRRLSAKHGNELTLFDIIGLWMRNDPRVAEIPNFATFLASVILITEAWLEGDRIAILGTPLIPVDHGEDQRAVELLCSRRISNLFFIYSDPLLDPLTFEAIVRKHRNRVASTVT